MVYCCKDFWIVAVVVVGSGGGHDDDVSSRVVAREPPVRDGDHDIDGGGSRRRRSCCCIRNPVVPCGTRHIRVTNMTMTTTCTTTTKHFIIRMESSYQWCFILFGKEDRLLLLLGDTEHWCGFGCDTTP